MATAYETLGLGSDATRSDLERAYQERRAAYDPARVAAIDPELAALATQRQAELELAYRSLRPALTMPLRLEPEQERRRDRELLVAMLALALLAALVPLLRDLAQPERTAVPEGGETAALTAKPAPPFTLEAIDGKQVSLSDYKGQVVLVNIWATWCPPCVRETPRLNAVYEEFKGQGFVILGVNTTYQDKREAVAKFAVEQGVSFPLLLDMDGSVGTSLGARLLPTSYLIDRDGKIVVTKVGEVDEAQLREQIAALLRGETP
ncbi:MAG TPA: redoxin domain-containing protein [Chloroflexaceae bacterium]|nr:redoxin domain-containing protein [Chloroflexaceae bacterium]